MSFSTQLFADSPEGPGKEQSWVTHLLVYHSPLSSIENCSATPSGTTPAFSRGCNESIVRGNAQLCSTSLSIDFSRATAFRADLADLWFPLKSTSSRSDFRVASSISDRW